MPTVTFDFRARGADAVRRSMQQVLDGAAGGRSGPARQAQQEQQTTRATLREIAIRQRAAERAAAATARAEARAGAASARETTKRQNAETAASVKRSREVMRWAESVERAERRATTATERGAARRAAAETRAAAARRTSMGRAGERMGQQAFGAVAGVASGIHGQVQDARRQYAASERTASIGIRGGGATIDETRARVRELQQFATTNGMDFSELTRAAGGSQGQFSTLAGENAGQRSEAFRNFLQSALFARNSGNDVEQTTRLQGFFQQQGFNAGTQRDLLRFSAGAANAGSVELGDMISQALQPITQRIDTAQSQLGPNATQEDRTRVAADTFRQTIAELQVQALSGTSARTGGNAVSSASAFLASPTRQAKILSNIQNDPSLSREQRTNLQSSLFTRGADGRQHLSTTNALDFADRFRGVVGNNPLAMRNVFAGTGEHGNGQALLANQRNALASLMRLDTQGRSRVRQLMSPDVALTEQSLTEGASLFGNDTTAQLNREDGARIQALTDNTSQLVRLSNAIAAWEAHNPFASSAASGVASGAGGLLAGAMGQLIGRSAAASTAFSALSTAAGAAGTALASAGAVAGAAFAGLAVGDLINRRLQDAGNGTNAASNGVGRGGGRQDDRIDSVFSMETWQEVGRMIAGGFNANARPSPQLADHATTLGRTLLAAERNRL